MAPAKYAFKHALIRGLEQQRALQEALRNPPALEVHRKLVNQMSEMSRAVASVGQQSDDLLRSISAAGDLRHALTSQMALIDRTLDVMRGTDGEAFRKRMAKTYIALGRATEKALQVRSALIGQPLPPSLDVTAQLVSALTRGIQESEDPQSTPTLNEITETVERLVNAKAVNTNTLTIILTILSVLLSLWLDAAHDEKMALRFDGLGESVGAAIAALELSTTPGVPPWVPTYYLSRDLHLREGPAVSAASLSVLPKNSVYEVVGLDQGWAQIRAFDWTADSTIVGWVYARYVHPLEPPAIVGPAGAEAPVGGLVREPRDGD